MGESTKMNSSAVYTRSVHRIKQAILFDHTLKNISCICANWNEFLIETSEWGIQTVGGVDFVSLTQDEITRLDQFMVNQNGYITDEDY
tara:strand:- start:346 stop:609 length:264 start_codon:yes stop_codon:yes gene_type:complete